MQLEVYQWLVPLIAAIFIIRTLRQYGRFRRTLRGTVLWILFWITITVLAILPDFISRILASSFGFKDNVNAIIFVALGGIYIFVFYLSASIRRTEGLVTDLVRELAKEKQRMESDS